MKKIKFVILLFFFAFHNIVYSSVKVIEVINDGWKFILEDVSEPSALNWTSGKYQIVNLPHTWNNIDVTDENPGYHRGIGWYQKEIFIEIKPGKKYFLNFNGANQVVVVYLNKKLVGAHIGGYSSFSFDITSYLLKENSNILEVKVDNRHNENIPPLSGDFNFFGGIYRDVFIETKSEIYFSGEGFNGEGVYWQTPEVSEKSASLRLFGKIANKSNKKRTIILKHQIKDSNSKIIYTITSKEDLTTGVSLKWETKSSEIVNPHLWSLENPYLYTIESSIEDSKTGELLDQIINYLGFRWYKFDPEKGFFLNGKPVKLLGASRHQDYPGLGNALPKEIHQQDVKALKECGLNFLRIAHYPQDQEVLKMCDHLGIICSVEIPIVNRITESTEFSEACKMMMKEMIWQNYNHPSLVIWSYMNEVMLQPRYEDDSLRQKLYFQNIAGLAQELENIARSLDPYRYTMIPNHGAFDIYNSYGLTKIPMIVGWNLYKGWYEADFKALDQFLDRHHAELPDKPVLISEYGAGNDPRLTSDNPVRFDNTNEYALIYHKYYYNSVIERPFVAGAFIWNLSDFSSNIKIDAMPYINNKGIHCFNREPKETAYFYKANLSKYPFVKIFLPNGQYISGIADSTLSNISYKSIHIYSNLDSVSLFHNQNKIATKPLIMGETIFNLPFKPGTNSINAEAYDKGKIISRDNAIVNFTLIPGNFDKFEDKQFEIRVSCGDNRYIYDPEIKKIWLPDQKYRKGSWGYIDGISYELSTRRGIKPGSDQSILNTDMDPLYQTQRIEPQSYKFDLKPGKYELTMCFAELVGSSKYDALKTSSKNATEPQNTDICFDIIINEVTVFKDFSPAIYGHNRAINKKFIIETNSGLEIKFNPKHGKPIINGIIVEKI